MERLHCNLPIQFISISAQGDPRSNVKVGGGIIIVAKSVVADVLMAGIR